MAGTGPYVPGGATTNDELAENGPDTTAEWIAEHTGIESRRWAAPGETTAVLATRAAKAALEAAQVDAHDIDLVLLATSTPDWQTPATATAVHHALGLRLDAGALDLDAACSSFVYALHVGASMLAGGESWTNVLVIGADRASSLTDPTDRSTRILFGDGAGAVVLRKELEIADVVAMAAVDAGIDPGAAFDAGLDGGPLDDETPGLRSVTYTVDHTGLDALVMPLGGTLEMDGPAVKTFAVAALVSAVGTACQEAGIEVDDLDLLVPHQSNRRLIEAAIDVVGLPESRCTFTVDELGNTGGASLPISLDVAHRDGRLRTGDLVCLAGYGAGLQSAACVLRWST
ncbi:MAG: beta-ketoacyl-ACP synthase 3 [Thermoleophilia bacterium]|nr:beta-ketoacyl-ACP synthase 3 [Thermoleophilia bacterium]